MSNTQPNLADIVKGTPKGNKAVQKALVGAARDQEATKLLAELDKILKQNFSGNYEISCTRCSESIDISYKPSKNAKQALLDWHNKHTLEARISTLKKLKNTRPNAELDDQTSDYLRGYREMEAKIGFELNRLNKLREGKP